MPPYQQPFIHHDDHADLVQEEDLYYSITDSVSYFTKRAPAKKIKRKHVTFNENVTCKIVLHYNDYTYAEKQACWYNQTEWKAMRHNVKEAVRAMSTTSNKDQECDDAHITTTTTATTPCTRGLENRTPKETKRKRQKRLDVCLAVINEQERQWNDGIVDSDKIAFISGYFTHSCKIQARAIGVMDELEALGRSV